MTLYECECCQYSTTIKCNFEKHMRSIKHVKSSQSHHLVTPKSPFSHPKVTICDNETKNGHECKYCGKLFKYKQGMYRHIKYACKKNEDEDLKELVRLLNKQLEDKDKEMQCQIERMQKQIEKLSSKLQIQQINSHNNNNNQNYNIKILNYNKTDYSHLTEEDYVRCIKDCNKCVKTIIEKVHFNKNKPENMNLYISSIKGNYVMMYKDNQWQIANRKEAIDDMYDKNEFELENWYDEYKTKYPEIIKSFKRYLKNKDESDDTINDVKDEIIMMLYNKRKMIDIFSD